MSKKIQELSAFFDHVRKCQNCHGKDGILVPTPKPLPDPSRVRVILLGEQPDRATAGGKGSVGLQADPSLQILRQYVEASGVDTESILYLPAVQCLPKDETARTSRPSVREVRNCTPHLKTLLAHFKPSVVVPLGHTAIQVLQGAWDDWSELRQFILNYDVGAFLERNGVAVYPLYFPSNATLKARGEARQRRDWQRLAQVLDSVEKRAGAR
jgi:uracil-DNA glycosylase family 4